VVSRLWREAAAAAAAGARAAAADLAPTIAFEAARMEVALHPSSAAAATASVSSSAAAVGGSSVGAGAGRVHALTHHAVVGTYLKCHAQMLAKVPKIPPKYPR
jgi:hypothetical protein